MLVEDAREGGDKAKYTSDLTWYITINTNPDGYVKSHVSDRMWRKTTNTETPGRCTGVDPNRNFDANWSGPGASSNPCSDTYYGVSAFSEKETQAMADFLGGLNPTPKVYADIHAYSQYWMFPYAYKKEQCSNHNQLLENSKEITEAIYSGRSKYIRTFT